MRQRVSTLIGKVQYVPGGHSHEDQFPSCAVSVRVLGDAHYELFHVHRVFREHAQIDGTARSDRTFYVANGDSVAVLL
jgi:hypothetical protein